MRTSCNSQKGTNEYLLVSNQMIKLPFYVILFVLFKQIVHKLFCIHALCQSSTMHIHIVLDIGSARICNSLCSICWLQFRDTLLLLLLVCVELLSWPGSDSKFRWVSWWYGFRWNLSEMLFSSAISMHAFRRHNKWRLIYNRCTVSVFVSVCVFQSGFYVIN